MTGQRDIVSDPPAPGKTLNEQASSIAAVTKTNQVGKETRQ